MRIKEICRIELCCFTLWPFIHNACVFCHIVAVLLYASGHSSRYLYYIHQYMSIKFMAIFPLVNWNEPSASDAKMNL